MEREIIGRIFILTNICNMSRLSYEAQRDQNMLRRSWFNPQMIHIPTVHWAIYSTQARALELVDSRGVPLSSWQPSAFPAEINTNHNSSTHEHKTPKNQTPWSPDTSNFVSEHMQRTACIYAELIRKYADQLQDPINASPLDQGAIQHHVDALDRMQLVEYTASSWPSHIKSQEEWDTIRADFTHDKNNLPDVIPAIKYTGRDGTEKILSLLTVCHNDFGTPQNDIDTVCCKNHVQGNGKKTSYMSFEYIMKKLAEVVPTREDFLGLGFTETTEEWNRDLMRLLWYYWEDILLTKWYHPTGWYKDESAGSSFGSSSSPGADYRWGVFVDPDYAKLDWASRRYSDASLRHL